MRKSKVNFESYFVLLVMLPTLTLLYFVYISYEQLLTLVNFAFPQLLTWFTFYFSLILRHLTFINFRILRHKIRGESKGGLSYFLD